MCIALIEWMTTADAVFNSCSYWNTAYFREIERIPEN